tara:strand:+ start:84 stop:554 length:471 start_codon:yes stop_codon:yes gene_type:complete
MKLTYKIKNFFTFGLMKRLDEAECKIINLREKVSDMDVESEVEEIINRESILTEGNFDPSDYDLVSSNDYDFDSFITEDDSVGEQDVEKIVKEYLEDYHDAKEMDEAIKEAIEDAQIDHIKNMVKIVCTEMLIDWCKRTAEAEDKQEETDSSSDNS